MGDYGRWQLKVVLLLWIPMFFCGTQFVTTDFMTWEPKVLFCEDTATCTSGYEPVIFPSNYRSVYSIFAHNWSSKCLFYFLAVEQEGRASLRQLEIATRRFSPTSASTFLRTSLKWWVLLYRFYWQISF